jgi:hypothetical protein
MKKTDMYKNAGLTLANKLKNNSLAKPSLKNKRLDHQKINPLLDSLIKKSNTSNSI